MVTSRPASSVKDSSSRVFTLVGFYNVECRRILKTFSLFFESSEGRLAKPYKAGKLARQGVRDQAKQRGLEPVTPSA